jgi:hypothetical protein
VAVRVWEFLKVGTYETSSYWWYWCFEPFRGLGFEGAASYHFKFEEAQRLRRLSRFSYYLISIDAQNAVIADWAVIPNGISFLPKSSFSLSFSAEDLHTVYDGVYDHLHSQVLGHAPFNESIRIQPLEASGQAIASPTRSRAVQESK